MTRLIYMGACPIHMSTTDICMPIADRKAFSSSDLLHMFMHIYICVWTYTGMYIHIYICMWTYTGMYILLTFRKPFWQRWPGDWVAYMYLYYIHICNIYTHLLHVYKPCISSMIWAMTAMLLRSYTHIVTTYLYYIHKWIHIICM